MTNGGIVGSSAFAVSAHLALLLIDVYVNVNYRTLIASPMAHDRLAR